MSTTCRIRAWPYLHDPGDLAELATNPNTMAPAARVTALMARPRRGRRRRTDDQTDQSVGRSDQRTGLASHAPGLYPAWCCRGREMSRPRSARRRYRAEERRRGEHGRRDGDALGDRLWWCCRPRRASVRIWAPSPSTSPDISAMPWALSETGPKVSMATMTPTVVSRPHPAKATRKSERGPPRRRRGGGEVDRATDDRGGVDRRPTRRRYPRAQRWPDR